MSKVEIRYTGTGGQGIILLGVLTADAATRAGNYATQGSYYGAQVRGGITSADVVLSKEWIAFPYVEKSDILMALTTESLHYYLQSLKEESLIVVDETIVTLEGIKEISKRYKFVRVPFTRICFEKFNSAFLMNIVAFGYMLRHLGDFFTKDFAIEALKDNVPQKYVDMELDAFELGFSI